MQRKSQSERIIRMAVDLDPEAYERLERLEIAGEHETKALVMRVALRIYAWVLSVRKQGGKLQVDRGGTIEDIAGEQVYHHPKPSKATKRRITLDLRETPYRDLQRIVEEGNHDSQAEVVRIALGVYEKILAATKDIDGREVFVVTGDMRRKFALIGIIAFVSAIEVIDETTGKIVA